MNSWLEIELRNYPLSLSKRAEDYDYKDSIATFRTSQHGTLELTR